MDFTPFYTPHIVAADIRSLSYFSVYLLSLVLDPKQLLPAEAFHF